VTLEGERVRGIVTWFGDDYGFIKIPDGPSVFVHWSQIVGARDYLTLYEGEEVEFRLSEEPRGYAAHSVTVVDSPQDRTCSATGRAYPSRNRYNEPNPETP
jgi:cold shock CspA family protein